ncbi:MULTISPECIES: nuclease-related domain-containing protein [unclassified Nocardia]|uniref:nuclease-related domain-containing protein n=1 Tax=unclassified Nocardia TaxID=2637762 RepID=UPI001CE40B55|nr:MULTISPECIES: nuclease-related domain-containing protein [unclassified Nocardia]
MLVVNERADAPYSEKVVAGWLRSCNVPGCAVAGGYVPGRGRSATGQEADFIVFTPNTCVCIEVKGTLSPIGGMLSCPVNGRWSMPGFSGDPVHVRGSDVNPLNQAKSAMYSLKSITKSTTGAERFVSALVVVVPRSGTTVTLDKPSRRFMPKGVDVLLGDRPHELFAWFQRGTYHVPVWTVERVHAMFAALGVNDPAASPAVLAAQGFPDGNGRSTESGMDLGADSFASTTLDRPVQTASTSTMYTDDYAAELPRFTANRHVGSAATVPPLSSGYPLDLPAGRLSHGRRASIKSALLTIAAFGVLGCGVWYVVSEHSQTHPDSNEHPAEVSVTESPAAPPPPPPTPVEAPPVARSDTHFCFPFQPNC